MKLISVIFFMGEGTVFTVNQITRLTIAQHKWFFQPYDIGGLLVKQRADLIETFHRSPEYYRDVLPQDEPLHWYQYSMEGSRRFRALKLWMSWKFLGTEGLDRKSVV